MNAVLTLASNAIRIAGAASPRYGAAVALPLFTRVPKPRPVAARDEITLSGARQSTVRITGLTGTIVDVVVYEWGSGPRTVLLAHGWHGRASQFATLVRELVSEGFRVVAFDAPAHGATPGRTSSLIDWLAALTAIQRRHGKLHALVGHSLGGLAALLAAADGLDVERVVTVNAPAGSDALLRGFQRQLGYNDEVAAAFRQRFLNRFFPTEPDVLERLSAAHRPLPAATALLVVHDQQDVQIPFAESQRILQTNPGATMLATEGLGHNRILVADELLDAVLDLVAVPAETAAAATSS